jgi:hypothetical protein
MEASPRPPGARKPETELGAVSTTAVPHPDSRSGPSPHLGSDFGPNIDLTFGYTLIADGPGGFGFDLAIGGAVPQAVPESSTWAMMLMGFAGLGFAGYRAKAGHATLARQVT